MNSRDPLGFLAEELRRLEELELLRVPQLAPPGCVNVCSNDYLGFGSFPLPLAGAGGAGASALVCGYTPTHAKAEQLLAQWLQVESGLLFTSGYAANLGTLSALAGPQDLILSDALNHASIIDGCRLSRASVQIVPHADVAALRSALERSRDKFRRRLIVVESCFSMDEDLAPLAAIQSLAREHECIFVVDEAHAVGVLGAEGRGLTALLDVRPDVLVVPLGKSFGLQGAFVGGTAQLRSFLWNRARSFVFSTGISPAIAAAIPERLGLLRDADDLRQRLLGMAAGWRVGLREQGARAEGESAIVSWILGTPGSALAAQTSLMRRGVWASAIRPPTVPEGTARLRITASAALTADQVEQVGRALRDAARELL